MPAVTLSPFDLEPFADIDQAKAEAMIEDVLALAARVAPCITEDAFAHDAAARAVLRGVILRWNAAGPAAVTQRASTEGPFRLEESFETKQGSKGLFWPSEIQQLQELCRSDQPSSGAFVIDTLPLPEIVHADICSINFGATYCSCGAILTGSYPLYES